MRTLFLVAGCALLGGCACTPTDLAFIESGGGASVEAPTSTGYDVRVQGGRYMYGPNSQGDCTGVLSPDPMPCGKVLLVCTTDPHTGERTPVQMATSYTCGPDSPSHEEACAEQPEFGYFYGGCTD